MTEILVEIKVVLNADHNELKGTRFYYASPEIDDKVNDILIDALAEEHNVKKNKIKIMKGLHSSVKTIKII